MPTSPPSSNLRRFFGLSRPERRLLFEAWWRLLAAAVSLRLAPRRTLAKALAEAPPGESAGTSRAVRKTAGTFQIALAVSRVAAHHLVPMTCLPRSLALQRMLWARGIPAQIRIGVRKESTGIGGIAAHAWVEVNGVALGEPEAIAARFLPFVSDRF